MHLKRVEAFGFKSFADAVKIEFEPGLTAIVGPNGSGKSNISDAILWVFGEQSSKTLRGDNMQDVIFSGTTTRKALNMANVTLVLDNTNRELNIDHDEVSITRKLFKTGESEYQINSKKCRLKDVSDLLIDKGIGKDSFTIISQDKVYQILRSKPEERRQIFEEAAGILKYKKRKDETARKLQKTDDNLIKIDLIVDELSKQINPLKRQSEKAVKYNAYKEQLTKVEIGYLVEKISEIEIENQKNQKLENNFKTNILNKNIILEQHENSLQINKNELIQIEEQINVINLQNKAVIEQLFAKNTEHSVFMERQKVIEENENLYINELLKLQNEEKELFNEINSANLNQENTKIQIEKLNTENHLINQNILNLNNEKQDLINKRNELLRTKGEIINSIHSLENYQTSTEAIKEIIELKMVGVHNVLAEILKPSEEFSNALEIALGAAINYIVVDNQGVAKKAIKYLAENKKGRATFLPLLEIEIRSIPINIEDKIKNIAGYIGIASQLVEFDVKYEKAIHNQLGNVIVTKDLNSAVEVAKIVNQKFKIVTLDGNIIHAGGILAGGTNKNKRVGAISKKVFLDKKYSALDSLELELKGVSNEQIIFENKLNLFLDELSKNNIELSNMQELLNSRIYEVNKLKNKKNELENSITQINLIISKDDTANKQKEHLDEMHQLTMNKSKFENEISNLQSKKLDKNTLILTLESEIKIEQKEIKRLEHELQSLLLEQSKISFTIDSFVTRLNEEYQMTFEHAKDHFVLEIEINEAENLVRDLKISINSLGPINLDSIEQYKEVQTRFDEITEQKLDLEKSKNALLETINELDGVASLKFIESFTKIAKNFEEIFKKLFGGGVASLELTDPTNYLSTGIEIHAQPPGKNVKNKSLLSGGEKALTSIALLFSILEVNPVPFCLLDEVEAALDEANVQRYAMFLKQFSNKTQFIVITHRKGTMEEADSLYGVTMQESGVTKFVSVKFEHVDTFIE